MLALIVFFAFVLAVVVAVKVLLNRKQVRRSRRVLVWVGLCLMLPFFFVAFYLYMLAREGWHSC